MFIFPISWKYLEKYFEKHVPQNTSIYAKNIIKNLPLTEAWTYEPVLNERKHPVPVVTPTWPALKHCIPKVAACASAT